MNQEEPVPIANSMIVFREEFDDCALLFDPYTGKAFGVNPVAALIWKRLDGNHSAKAILDEITEKFSDFPEDIESHLKDFIQELVKNGFAGYEG
jgi:SynChlorMet cassette protein ScmD